jgi:hypothetical protein
MAVAEVRLLVFLPSMGGISFQLLGLKRNYYISYLVHKWKSNGEECSLIEKVRTESIPFSSVSCDTGASSTVLHKCQLTRKAFQ